MIVDVLLFMIMIAAVAILITGIILVPYITLPIMAIAIVLMVGYVIKHEREDVG